MVVVIQLCKRAVLAGAVVICLCASAVQAQFLDVPELEGPVNDHAFVLGPRASGITDILVKLKAEIGAEVVVLTVDSLLGETIEQFSIRVAEKWKIGRAGIDDGVILIVAVNDRRVRLEVGRGLEGDIPDALAKRIIYDHILPEFRRGDISSGVEAGVRSLDAVVRDVPLPAPNHTSGDPTQLIFLLVCLFVVGSILAELTGLLTSASAMAVVGALSANFVDVPLPSLVIGGIVGILVLLRDPILYALAHGNSRSSSGGSRGGFGGGGGSFGSGGSFSGGGASGSW